MFAAFGRVGDAFNFLPDSRQNNWIFVAIYKTAKRGNSLLSKDCVQVRCRGTSESVGFSWVPSVVAWGDDVQPSRRATGLTPKPIAPDVAKQTRQELETLIAKHSAMAMVWGDLLAKLRQTDPALFQHQAALA